MQLMDIYKPICKHIVIPLQAKWERSPYLKHLRYLENSQYINPEEMKAIQWKKIEDLLQHAYHHTQFYKERFGKFSIRPEEIQSWNDFQSIPILSKQEVQQNCEKLFADNTDKYISFLTSGSSGMPLRGYWNKESSQFKRACGRRSELWAGFDLGERVYCLYGNPEKHLTLKTRLRRRFLQRISFLDTLQLSEESMLHFAHLMQKKPPSIIWGHAHALYIFSQFLGVKGIDSIRPKGMYSAGMVLHNWERKKVEEVFHCKLQDRYGCEEFGLIACECKKQEGLHINTDSHYIEFLNKKGDPVQPGERGFIVVTDLTNRAMPFIRYNIEDIGIPSPHQCSCGRTQPLIERIEGRIADFLVTPDKKLISGISLTDHFAGHIPGVAQTQIIQGKIDNLTINIVKDNTFNEKSIAKIGTLVREFFGDKMKYRCEYREEIAKEPSGKYRFTICKIENDLF